jgi:4-amino-4-deoxy-L-arabinose transferase-like glycosyltransferase
VQVLENGKMKDENSMRLNHKSMITERMKHDRSIAIVMGFVLFFILFALFFNLSGRTLENEDSMRFAEVAREILETGDWAMMRLGGDIYVDKPPLHFWNIALSYRLFGVGSFAARFPSAFFAMIGFLGILLFSFSIDRENPKTAIYASLFLISNYAYAYYSRTARLDIEYSVLFSLSLISFYKGYESGIHKHKILFYLLFWIFMGMAFLEKGPVAFIPLLIVFIYHLIQRDRERLGFRILSATSPALALTILPWIIVLIMHKDFYEYIYLLKTSTIITRRAGFFYYIPALLLNFFPGSIFMAISLPFLWRWKDVFRGRPVLVFCLTWVAVYFVIIHLTVAKNLRYLMPILLPLSVITAWGTERMFSTGILSHRLWKRWKILVGTLAGLVCLAPIVWILLNREFMWSSLVLFIVSVFSMLFVWKRSKDVVVFTCIVCVLSFLFVDLLRTTFNSEVSDDLRLYTVLKDHNIQADEVLLYKTNPDLKRTFSFYYNRLLRQKDGLLEGEDRVKAVVTSPIAVAEVLKVYGTDRQTLMIKNHREEDKRNYYVVFPLLHK